MKPYKDSDKNSNIEAYEYGDDWITIRFKDKSVYKYTAFKAGFVILNQMKILADKGDGLNAFINKKKPAYSSKK